ncbi:hypothetical protein BRAO375_2460016 [Bradyrhizobium sp. ORS 375]|uniref:autotransporter outer membrane beta-barrel domain-containing protein n=1 Tax=Bradyrhizobium sp. (strain ORS 375) TaxID=566679 RepID=UPI0002408012|nr:autotransporter outer membrane beta-barrel domain-containing protein [Bradyrhizobium sp. ORS 375]CCD93195.1 hypothetical protein BRAO375_2460016 [Bradyrhizobium sp. ORS 375]
MIGLSGGGRCGRLVVAAAFIFVSADQAALADESFDQRFWSPLPLSSSFAGPLTRADDAIVRDGWTTYATGYSIDGHSITDNVVADGRFTSKGYVAGLAKRLSPNFTVGLRGQHGTSSVSYNQTPDRNMSVSSQGIAFDVIVEDQHVLWRTTASYADDSFNANFNAFTPGSWNGREWAIDSQFNVRWTFSRVVTTGFVGVRYLRLEQDAFTATDFFSTQFPGQSRESHQVRAGIDLLCSLLSVGPFQLLASASGQVRNEMDNHPPIHGGVDLTGMAGNSFTFDYANAEPVRFPAAVTWQASGGLELRAADTFHVFFNATTSRNSMLSWTGYQVGARFLF